MAERIVFLLEGTGLFGGTKVAFQQAELLSQQGFAVTVVAREPKPSWFPLRVTFRQVPDFSPVFLPEAELIVATFWTTIEPAMRLPWGRKVHYCQGFESIYAPTRDQQEKIERSYSHPIPAWVVSPGLARLLEERFQRPSFLLPPPLDPLFSPLRFKRAPRRVPRIVVPGPLEFRWKGVETALHALRLMRSWGMRCELWRISQYPLGDEERKLLQPDRYFWNIPPPNVASLLRASDLLLAPSWEEGFGLPLLEAMASGVPAVASDIDAFRFLSDDVLPLVPPGDPRAMAEAAMELLRSPLRWRSVRQAGLARAKAFASANAVRRLLAGVRWILDGAYGDVR